MAQEQTSSLKIGIRPETRRKFEAIKAATRMPFADIADVACDAYIAQHGIVIPEGPPEPDSRRRGCGRGGRRRQPSAV